MPKLAAGEAMTAGFRLVSREPAAFGVWVLLELLVAFVPSTLLQLTMPTVMRDPTAMMASAPWILVWSLGTVILLWTVLGGAALRAGIEPEKRGAFYLRLSGQEGWLFLSALVFGLTHLVFLIVAALVMTIVAGIGGVVVGGNPVAVGLLVILLYLGLLASSIWWFVRLGLMMPIGFRERRLGLMDAWRLSSGNTWRIFGVLAVLTVLMFVAYLLMFGAMFSSIATKVPLDQLSQEMARNPALFRQAMTPTALVAVGLFSVMISAIIRVMFFGAWADIYRQLKAPSAEVFS